MSDKKKVLVVEDDKPLRELLAMRLESQQYEVFAAENGQLALSLCKEQRPDLILLDVNLPDLLGVDILDSINGSEGEYGKPKIIVLTGIAYSIDDPKERWRNEYGVADFMTKPFDYEVLLQRIEAVFTE